MGTVVRTARAKPRAKPTRIEKAKRTAEPKKKAGKTCDLDNDNAGARNRPFKNVRERRRRAQMKQKFMQLHTVCRSECIASVVPKKQKPQAEEPISPRAGTS